MSLTINLPLEAERRLSEKADAAGVPLTDYVQEIILREAGQMTTAPLPKKRPRILEMRGLGAEIWKDIGDAQECINKEREEWNKEY